MRNSELRSEWKPIETLPLNHRAYLQETESPYREGPGVHYKACAKCVDSYTTYKGGILLPFRPSRWKELWW